MPFELMPCYFVSGQTGFCPVYMSGNIRIALDQTQPHKGKSAGGLPGTEPVTIIHGFKPHKERSALTLNQALHGIPLPHLTYLFF